MSESQTPLADAMRFQFMVGMLSPDLMAASPSKCATGSFVDYKFAAQLEKELAEARKDTERLDWLEQLHPWPAFHDGRWINYRGLEDHATLRAAIDAAKGTK
jgi:hypothetical protein